MLYLIALLFLLLFCKDKNDYEFFNFHPIDALIHGSEYLRMYFEINPVYGMRDCLREQYMMIQALKIL